MCTFCKRSTLRFIRGLLEMPMNILDKWKEAFRREGNNVSFHKLRYVKLTRAYSMLLCPELVRIEFIGADSHLYSAFLLQRDYLSIPLSQWG